MRATIGVYGMVPIAVLQDDRVKPNMIRVYAALASYQGGAERCWPSRRAIAERAGLSDGATSAAISELVDVGWIERERRPQHHETNRYVVRIVVESMENSDVRESECSENSDVECSENSDIPPCTKRTLEKNTSTAPAGTVRAPVPMKHPIDAVLDSSFRALADYANYGRERRSVSALRTYCERTQGDRALEYAESLFRAYEWLRHNGDEFWRRQPPTPSSLLSLVSRVESEMRSRLDDERERQEHEQLSMEFGRGITH